MKKRAVLNKTEFFDVYGVSLLAGSVSEADKAFLVSVLSPIAEKYLHITLYALRAELRYFLNGGAKGCGDYYEERKNYNQKVLKRLGIKAWNHAVRKSLPMQYIEPLFEDGAWDEQYGGEAWGLIATACIGLGKTIPVTVSNLRKVVSCIDRLNDLEHNNSLYLTTYTTFDLGGALELKADGSAEAVISHCSSDIQKLYREYRAMVTG